MTAGVVGLILATALNGYRVDVGPVGIRVEHVAFIVVAGAWLVRLVRERRSPVLLRDDWLLAGFLVIGALASLVMAPQPMESVKFLALMVFGVLLYWVVRDIVAQRSRTFRRAVDALVLVGFAEGVVAIVRWATAPLGISWGGQLFGFDPGGIVAADCVFTFAPRGTFPEPSILGSYLTATSLAAMLLLLSGETRARRRWLALATTVALVGLGLTLSRGAWLAFAGGLVFLVVTPYGRIRVRLGLVAGAAAVVTLAATVSVVLSPAMVQAVASFPGGPASCAGPASEGPRRGDAHRPSTERRPDPPGGWLHDIATATSQGAILTSARVFNTRTFRFRWEGYRAAFDAWRAHPWIGNGVNAFAQTHADSTGKGWISNLELMELHDTGVLGLALLLAWLAWVGWDTLRTLRQADRAGVGAALTGLAIGFAALFIAYQTTTAFWLGFTWVHLALIRGGTLILQRRAAGG